MNCSTMAYVIGYIHWAISHYSRHHLFQLVALYKQDVYDGIDTCIGHFRTSSLYYNQNDQTHMVF